MKTFERWGKRGGAWQRTERRKRNILIGTGKENKRRNASQGMRNKRILAARPKGEEKQILTEKGNLVGSRGEQNKQ